MRSKVTVVLLFLNVVLFFYIYKFEAVQLPNTNGRRVLPAEIASMDSLTRITRTGETVKLERRGESWWITQPYEWPADRNAVSSIDNALQFLEHETSFPVADLNKTNQSLASFGLEQPAIILIFTAANKKYTLKIGDDTAIAKRLYVLSPDETRIHVVGRSLADRVGLPLEELRAKSIFTVPVFEVRSVKVQAAAPSNLKVSIRRDNTGHWGFESPILARASKTNVEVTVNALNGLVPKKFLEPRDTDLERAGLNAPALRVTLEGNARRETLLLGNPSGLPRNPAERGVPGSSTGPASAGNGAPETEFFAKIEDKSVVFTTSVPQPLLDVLRTAQESLRDPHVLDFEPGTITAFTLTAPGQPELNLQRLDAASGAATWQVVTRISGQAPLTTAADTILVTELLQKIQLLAARRFLTDAPSAADIENYGFNRPEREITLSLNTGGGPRGTDATTQTLQIGISPDKPGVAFARVPPAQFVYEILPDLLDETPALARHYRQRLLRELPEGARITSLALTDLGTNMPVYAQQIAETDKNWDRAVAAEPVARRKAISDLLQQLHVLRAKRYTADSFTADHADTPEGSRPWKYRIDITVTFSSGGGAAQNSTSTLFFTDRLGGNTLLAGTPEFGGVVFEVTQEMLDALFALTYGAKTDPGLPATPPAGTPPPAKEPVATPASPKADTPPKS